MLEGLDLARDVMRARAGLARRAGRQIDKPADEAARYELPTVYWKRLYVTGGGLISYGPDLFSDREPLSKLTRPTDTGFREGVVDYALRIGAK